VVIEEPLVDLAGLFLKTLVSIIRGHRVLFNMMESLSQTLTLTISLDFPRSCLNPRIRDWSSTFNFQFDLSLLVCPEIYMKPARRPLTIGEL
jgi:hypothetical protein